MTEVAGPILKKAIPLSTNVLIIGGAYAGLSALVAMKNHARNRTCDTKISATIIEPKAGLLNILGIPRAIVDVDFAKTQYVPFQNLQDLKFHRLISDDQQVCDGLGKSLGSDSEENLSITYVQGAVSELTSQSAVYALNNDASNKQTIAFEYVVIATGRNRQWPTSPLAFNYDSYMEEMVEFNKNVIQSKSIGVIGAGAVGIEIAGDIKNRYKDKDVYLIHPHEKFPPEPLSEEFQDACRQSLERGGVSIMTQRRVATESEDKKLTFTDGTELQTDFNYWCNAFRNNTDIFEGDLKKYISPKNNVYVNEYLQLEMPEQVDCLPNVFAIGDLVEFPIIKSAGWALYMGRQVANNILLMILDGKLVENMPDLTKMPKGMVLIAGNEELVSLLDGVVELNNENYVEEYKDYCLGKIRVTLGA